MAIQTAKIVVTGTSTLLLNNPQTVDPFNHYSRKKKPLTAKKSKTDEDLLELGELDIESKTYFDAELGVYIPASWLIEQICTSSFGTIKVSKDKMRGGIFAPDKKIKLFYDGMKKVKTIKCIVKDEQFHHRMILPQQNIRIAKNFPKFDKWSFSTVLEFDDNVVDLTGLRNILTRSAKYVGFGDFRPTFGAALAEVTGV